MRAGTGGTPQKNLQVPPATGTCWDLGPGPRGAHSHPTRVNTPATSPGVHKTGVSHFHPADSLSVGELEPPSIFFFFLNDNFPPFFVAKNHPGLSRREGRKLCGEREGRIISLGHRHSRLSSVCRRRSGKGGRARPDARLEDENEGWPKSITVLLGCPWGGVDLGGGREQEREGALGSDQGPGKVGRLQRAGGRRALLSQLDRPTSRRGPQFPLLENG